jgi:hypothetical protein
VGQIIESREHVQTYWIHTSWIAFIFLIHISSWFAFWSFRDVEVWSIAKFLMLLSIPTLLYLVSHICVPEVLEDGPRYDMRSYYYARHRVMLGLLALTLALSLLNDYFLVGTVQFSAVNVTRLLALMIVFAGACFRHPRVHAGIVIALALLAIYSMNFLNHSIS